MRHPEKYESCISLCRKRLTAKEDQISIEYLGSKILGSGKTTIQLFRVAANKVMIANIIANMIAKRSPTRSLNDHGIGRRRRRKRNFMKMENPQKEGNPAINTNEVYQESSGIARRA